MSASSQQPTDQELLRYSRHLLLEEIGIEGHDRLRQCRALILGLGGLGCPAASYLASSGIGGLTLVDPDTIDASNLPRQLLYGRERVGTEKSGTARRALHQLNPDVEIRALTLKAEANWLLRAVPGHDVVLDCTDNFASRQAANLACVLHGVPLVSGSAIRFDGQLSVYDTRQAESPCYACNFPVDAAPVQAECATMGVLAPLAGVIGALQAVEAMKILTGCGEPMVGKLLVLDALRGGFEVFRTRRKLACPVCSDRP